MNRILAFALAGAMTMAFAEQELDLSFLKGLESKAAESTSIDLGPDQLKLMLGFVDGGSKEMGDLARMIERVQVRTFEFDKEGMYSLADMENLRQKVKAADFVPFISTKERKGFTEILMRKGPKGLRGFVILTAEPKELTVVNIVGDLDLNSLSKLSGKLGIPNMSLENQGKGSSKKEE